MSHNYNKNIQKKLSHPCNLVTILGAGEVFIKKIKPALLKLGIESFNIYDPGNGSKIGLKKFSLKGPVLILSPNNFHISQIKHSLNLGLATYVDKPMVISVQELEALEKTLKTTNAPLYCGDYYYFKALPLLEANGKLKKYAPFLSQYGSCTHTLTNIESVEAVLLEGIDKYSGSIEHRSWLAQVDSGGGMLLDLMIHLTNILNMLELGLEDIHQVNLRFFDKQSQTFKDIKDEDKTEDYAEVYGTLKGNIPVKLKAGKYAPAHKRYIRFIHSDAHTTTLYFTKKNFAQIKDNRGKLIWHSELMVDPYWLTMYDALEFFYSDHSSRDKLYLYWEEQALSIRQIEAVKNIAFKKILPLP